ncbi:hypothetical protein ATANTOWER_027764 [Ataeniobius toweri]|uniref:Uncharacterized protein n=1 Tax=Ataeniobius toweri TaxID=208326 RepID=A0ABU7CJ89_9TELE|nr:hypothetical protein [Ataeniobius toweri]
MIGDVKVIRLLVRMICRLSPAQARGPQRPAEGSNESQRRNSFHPLQSGAAPALLCPSARSRMSGASEAMELSSADTKSDSHIIYFTLTFELKIVRVKRRVNLLNSMVCIPKHHRNNLVVSFLFQPFCCRLSAVFGITDPVCSILSSCQTDILAFDFGTLWFTEELMIDSVTGSN